MRDSISFVCPGCGGRLRASARFLGRSCGCPRCGQEVTVPPNTPAEEAPLLVLDDGHQLFRRGGARSYAAAETGWRPGRH
jgi:hypothetical protein